MTPLDDYLLAHSSSERPLLKELRRQTHLRQIHPRMLSGPVQGRLLEFLVRMIRPSRVLEIGTFTGYSALSMAAGLPQEAIIDTIEANDELETFAQSFFDRSPDGHKIRLHIGPALEIVPRLGQCYDFVFIDADKREYPAYLTMLLDGGLVHAGSYLLADNVLWDGKVAAPAAKGDVQTAAIQRFNAMVAADERLENVILPIRDGLNLIRVK